MRINKSIVFASTITAAFLTTNAHAAAPKDGPGPIDSLSDLQDSAKIVFKLADTNNDGLIAQKEAIDFGHLLVGGFFFRADADGDGKVTEAEAEKAQEDLLNQRPLLRFIADRAEQEATEQGAKADIEKAKKNIMGSVDTNKDGAIDATELRQAVQTTVQSLFLTADTSGDGQLSPAELNGAVVEVGRAVQQASFKNADADNDGALSREEFNKAIVQPAGVVFRVLDKNNDGKITDEEVQAGAQVLIRELRNLQVPEPANSLSNQLKKAVKPGAAPRPQ